MPAASTIRFNPILRQFYFSLLERGKRKMTTVGTIMRKLLHIIYGVLKHQQPFDPNHASAVDSKGRNCKVCLIPLARSRQHLTVSVHPLGQWLLL